MIIISGREKMLKVSGECKCGLKRDIEYDDASDIQQIKNMPCPYCGSTLKYKSGNDN